MPRDGPVAYEPRSVKAILAEMKDIAELLIDLSYSSVLFEDADLAEEVLELESRMDVLQLQARMSLVMAGRSPEDAEALAPVFSIVGAAEKISDAAGDIAKVIREDIGHPPALKRYLPDAVETLARATVVSGSAYADRTLGEINLETERGVRVIAIRRGEEWVLDPDRDTRLRADDVVICRGSGEAVGDVYRDLTGEALEAEDAEPGSITDLDRAVESVVLMKNMSELAVDLAYGSVLFDSTDLAEEVRELEIEVDALQSRFEVWALRAAGSVGDPASIRGLLHIAASTEVISDAAVEISEGVLRGFNSHPVVEAAVGETDEMIVRVVVQQGSDLEGDTIGEVKQDAGSGVQVLAIRRGDDGEGTQGDWLLSPDRDVDLRGGDHLIAKGTRAGAERLGDLAV
jgi:uncharacterized protein with PhoU and TrkA domain